MTDDEKIELLIRMDVTLTNINKVMFEEKPSYPIVRDRVKQFGKVVWGVVILTIGATIKTFWSQN